MIEFRLYYECLEQAHDYILPMVGTLSSQYEFKLIRKPSKSTIPSLQDCSIKAIYTICTPDILLTAVYDNIEYPLLQIEFTEAVTTEDHELQRTYGAVASYLANMYYIKVSGDKKPKEEFGGGKYNPYSTPKILMENIGYEGFIIAEWKTTSSTHSLQQNSSFPACPPEIPIIKETLQCIVNGFVNDRKNWFSIALTNLKQTQSFADYITKVNEGDNFDAVLKTWVDRDGRQKSPDKLRYFVRDNWIGAKINRFGHAMDPDRGILTYISILESDKRKVFGIYALYRERVIKVKIDTLTTLQEQLRVAFLKDEFISDKISTRKQLPLKTLFANKIIALVAAASSLNDEIDITDFWKTHQNKLAGDVVLQTLAYFLDGMCLNYNGIKLVWDRRKLLGNTHHTKFLDLLGIFYNYSTLSKPFEIEEVKKEVDEDEVTYAIVHRVLIPNGFKIVSISYPGSQGGGAVLPEPEKGKEQPREYPDIIAVSPNSNEDIILNESKGMFKQSDAVEDATKILRYKTEPNYKEALKKTLVVAKVIDENNSIRNIIIGVAFGVARASNTSTTWQPDKIDFIFRVVDREEWAIGIFNQTLRDLIPVIEGQTNFPTVYQISKTPKKVKIKTPKKTKKS
jgi:hypothetical protein